MTNISIGKKTLATATLISGVAGFNSANRCKPSVCRNTKSRTLNMKRPKTLLLAWLLALLCLASTGLARAEQVSIGDPETTSGNASFPWNGTYKYSYTQQIYTADEIGTAGTINSLTVWLYDADPNNALPTFNIDIYMKEVDKNAFSGTTDWVSVSSSDKVYTGTLTVLNTTARAYTFTLDKTFTYSGQGNLLIAFDDNTGSWNYGLRGLVLGNQGDPNRAISVHSDGTNFDPMSMSGVTAYATAYQRNVIRLGMFNENLSYNHSITIGDLATASNNSALPWYGVYDYSYTQQIYTAEEIGTTGTINAVTMWLVHTGNSTNEPLPTFNIDIYMKEVDKETFSGGNDWVSVSADDMVYSGSVKVTNTSPQSFIFTLATPFAYSGQGNLLIAFDDNTGSWKGGLRGMVFGGESDPNRAIYTCRDGSDYDPFGMSSINGSTLAQRNVIALSMTDCPTPQGQSNVTIGNLETASSIGGLPWLSVWNYSYSQQIYTAEEIGTAGTINTVTMWLVHTGSSHLPSFNIDIYMKEVDKSGFSGTTDWVGVSSSDKVYSSMVTVTNKNVQSFTFTLDTPFEYSGEGSLLIAFDDNTGRYVSGLRGMVFGTEGDPIRAIYAYRDGSDYDPLNMSGITANTTTYQRNVVEFGIVPAPSSLTVYDGTATNWQVPAYFNYFDAFSKSQFVIPADDLMEMEGGTISSMKFYIPYIWYFTTNCPVDVYVMEVDYTTINAYEPKANAAIVYQGSLTVNQVGYSAELTVNFTEPYQYLGGNLLVGMENTETGSHHNCGFYGTTVDGASISGYTYSLDGYYPPTQRNFIPKTTFTYQIADPGGCGRPMTLVAQYISNNGATTAWTGGSGTYNVETKTGNGDWTRVCSDLGANTYTFENLEESTEYRVRVQSVCGDEVSGWKAVTFTTLCGPVTVTTDMAYTEDFESPAGTGWQSQGPLPDCWRAYSTGDIAPHNLSGDNQNLVIVGDGDNYAILPKFSNPLDELQIRFLSRTFNSISQLELGYLTDEDDGTCNTFTNIASYVINPYGGYYMQFTTDLQNVPSEATQLAFRFSDAGQECYIDDVVVAIPCTEPEAPVVIDATASSVTLDWTPAEGTMAWDLYLSQDYNDIPNDETVPTVANVTTHPYTIDTGLNFTATCVPYVRTRCGAMSHSGWVRSYSSFGVPCDEPITVTTDMAYTEDFGSPAGTHWQSQGPLPDCWRAYSTGNPAPHIMSRENQNLVIVGDGDNYAILPKFSNPISELQISFLSRTFNGVSQLELGYLTAGDDGTCNTFTNIASYEIYWNYGNYLQFTTALQSVPAEAAQLAFRFNDDGQECYIDDVEVAIPCTEPEALVVTNATVSSVTLDWTPAEGTSAWDLYLSQDYNDIPNDETVPTVANVTTHPYTIDTGLNFTATCVPYVRTRCGAMSHSGWVRSYSSFGVPCDEPITVTTDMAYTEDFGSPAGTHWQSQGPLPDCWRTYSTGNPAPHIQNVENQNLVIVGDGDNYAILPKFSNPLDELQISFLSRTFNSISQLELGYLTDEDDGTCNTFTNIASYVINPYGGYYMQLITYLHRVPAEATQLAFRFSDAGQECYIDDVEVALNPYYNPPCEPVLLMPGSPYMEDFESPVGTSYNVTGPLPSCWAEYTTYSVLPHNANWGGGGYVHSGSQSLILYSAGDCYALLPEFVNPINQLHISFWMRTQTARWGQLQLGYIIDEDDGTCNTFTTIATYPNTDLGGNIAEFNTALNNVPAEAKRLVFKWNGDGDTHFVCIDDLEVSATVSPIVTQTIELVSGWNWVSFNVETTLEDLQAALVSTGNTSITIKSKAQNSYYQNGRWRGNLNFDVAMMYKIYVGSACEITLEGMPINPSEHPITIHNGPNWIGFPLSGSMTLDNAFAGFAVNGDVIKYKGGSANYQGGRWRGAFNLQPGQGYIYNSNVQGDRILTFPANAK